MQSNIMSTQPVIRSNIQLLT